MDLASRCWFFQGPVSAAAWGVPQPHLQLCLRAVTRAFSALCSGAWSPVSSRARQGWGGWCWQQLLSWCDLSGLPPGENGPGCRGRTHPGWRLRPVGLGAAGRSQLLPGRRPSCLAYSLSHCLCRLLKLSLCLISWNLPVHWIQFIRPRLFLSLQSGPSPESPV